MSRRNALTPAGGLPALLLLVAAVVSSAVVATRPEPPRADLTLWTFAKTHADSLRNGSPSPLDLYEQHTGRQVDVRLIAPRAMDLRLLSMLRGRDAGGLPDVVQIESLSAAKFLDGRDVPLLRLDDRLDHRLDARGLRRQFYGPRFATWQRGGATYGVPSDVNPVALAYRRDLFAAAGVDPSVCATWDDLAAALATYCDYWHAHGRPYARGLELARSKSDHLTLMLQQRGVALADAEGRPTLGDPRLLDTLVFYAKLIAGGLAGPTSDGHERWAGDLARGDVAMLWMPDWRVKYLELAAPELAGKLALMPLPKFEPGDAPTAVWGGTMLAIPRGVRDPDAAWDLLKFVASDPLVLAAERRASSVLPPLPGVWEQPAYQRGDSYFGGQAVNALYAELAAQTRPEPTTPLRLATYGHLAALVSHSTSSLDAGGTVENLRATLPAWIADAEADLARRASFYGRGGEVLRD